MKIDLSDEELARFIELLEEAGRINEVVEGEDTFDDELYVKLTDFWETKVGTEWVSPNSPCPQYDGLPSDLWG